MSDIVERDSEWPSSVDHGPFKAERHESGWWIITNARGCEVDDSGDGGFTEKSALWIAEAMNDKHAETILALRKEVEEARADAALARQGYETAYAEFDGKCRAVNKLAAELAEANETIIAFSAPWAVAYARDYGLPNGHLHTTHYDILEKAGGRMDDFTRAALATEVE